MLQLGCCSWLQWILITVWLFLRHSTRIRGKIYALKVVHLKSHINWISLLDGWKAYITTIVPCIWDSLHFKRRLLNGLFKFHLRIKKHFSFLMNIPWHILIGVCPLITFTLIRLNELYIRALSFMSSHLRWNWTVNPRILSHHSYLTILIICIILYRIVVILFRRWIVVRKSPHAKSARAVFSHDMWFNPRAVTRIFGNSFLY